MFTWIQDNKLKIDFKEFPEIKNNSEKIQLLYIGKYSKEALLKPQTLNS